jgi:hypothetical protein
MTSLHVLEDNIQEDYIAENNIRENNIQEDNIPEDNIPENSIPDNIQEDNIPEDNIPENNIRENNIQEDNIPDDLKTVEITTNNVLEFPTILINESVITETIEIFTTYNIKHKVIYLERNIRILISPDHVYLESVIDDLGYYYIKSKKYDRLFLYNKPIIWYYYNKHKINTSDYADQILPNNHVHKTCPYFKKGRCNRGYYCRMIHVSNKK